MPQSGMDFNAIRISLASPKQVKAWSYGEVTKPETINYRTLRPEKDGLFCEKIFGPTKDWECYCGKYKKIRYKGVVCDRCGVEVARSKVRRERMGHIKLAAPVAHIWFSKSTPSRLGLLLDISPGNLERVLYFAQYIVTQVDEEIRKNVITQLEAYSEAETQRLKENSNLATENKDVEVVLSEILKNKYKLENDQKILEINTLEVDPNTGKKVTKTLRTKMLAQAEEAFQKNLSSIVEIKGKDAEVKLAQETENLIDLVKIDVDEKIKDLNSIKIMDLLTEARFRDLRDKFGEVFKASMGAEAILEILKSTDLDSIRNELKSEINTTSGQRRKKAIKRLRVIEAFRKSGNKPEWMIMENLPVLPPELHPMVQLDGGRFATSDLNDLYRRVINRNNRLRHLIELLAPEIIVRNEKRMLQEAVDALIDNGRRGRAIQGSHNHQLKSLTHLLRGKQGRFRQNLLGKRVDYSGRSVIISGPQLRMNECGLPRKMALELFKPFVMNALVVKGYAHNIKSAKRMTERARPEIWDILEEVIQNHPVMLNRAPTLHRLGIQAFQPVLVDGFAIQIHPLVCTAFNADFDGDQMAVHVPLSKEAVMEAQKLMLSTNNMLAPSSGFPIVSPTLDMVLGAYYLTGIDGEGVTPVNKDKEGSPIYKKFANFEDAEFAYDSERVKLREIISVRNESGDFIETTVGRIIFNSALPDELSYRNQVFNRGAIEDLVYEVFNNFGNDESSKMLDKIKDLGFKFATKSGTTIAIKDIVTPPQKQSLLSAADTKVNRLNEQYFQGVITRDEKYKAEVDVWTDVSNKMTRAVEDTLPTYGGIFSMADSGAKGNIAQIKQMAGMRGLMSDPKGRIIEMPIRSSFVEGLSVLEYFISTHGARKGLADTALRTADSGYLTRRLADVAQDVIITAEEDEFAQGILIKGGEPGTDTSTLSERIITRYLSEPIVDPGTGEIIADKEELVTHEIAQKISDLGITEAWVYSPLSSTTKRGISQKCYGASLATGQVSLLGEAVGIIAAQSIGEPGTQLTMRTFHTGGIAGKDITSGLPRVVELFEARQPKGVAVLSEISGEIELAIVGEEKIVRVKATDEYTEEISIPATHKQTLKSGDWVDAGDPILSIKKSEKTKMVKSGISPDEIKDEILSPVSGVVSVSKTSVKILWSENDEREYIIPAASEILVTDGEKIQAGHSLSDGPKNPQDILRIEGQVAAQRYIVDEVQSVYRSQGVQVHDKHIEVIVRQMMRKVRIDSAGDTEFLPGELVDRHDFETSNKKVMQNNGMLASASPVLLGVTRASLNTQSFLAAASFQETARVLTEAAVNGSVDQLSGLKENVIIGRLIPARLDQSDEGRKKLGMTHQPRDKELTGFTEAPATFEEALAAISGGENKISESEINQSLSEEDDLSAAISALAEEISEDESSESPDDDITKAAEALKGSLEIDDSDEEIEK